jgi:adenosylcobinamide kinase / adenosylcobinamide-phosphate guanylyltransferase
MYIFVTGGYRSGRSSYALRRAAELGAPPWLYVTSGEETEESVRKRIARQRRDKEAIWRTATTPVDLRALLQPAALEGLGALVLDGFTGWLTTRIAAAAPADDGALLAEIEDLADRLYRTSTPVIVVSQEMGWGAIPPRDGDGKEERRYIRVAAGANQILAGMASSVVLMVSGVPLKVR